MSKETELSDEQIDCCVGNLGMAENSILAGPDEIRRAMRAAIAADRELRWGDAELSSECIDCGGTGMRDSGGFQPWGEAVSIPCGCDEQEDAQRQGDAPVPELPAAVKLCEPAWGFTASHMHEYAQAVLAAKRELAEELAALTSERDALRKDAERLVWAMDRIGMGTTSIDFAASVLRRGGTGDLGDCRAFIDEAIAKEKAK